MKVRRFCVWWLGGALALCAAEPMQPVIMISVDTLRADHVGLYGYRRIATPNMDAFAAGGTVFKNIASQTPLTLPSHTSLFTSTYPFVNGIQENAERVPAGVVTLATTLKARGYKTAAFVSSVFLEQEMGLDQGFETYDSPFHFAAFSPVSGEMFLGGTPNSTYAVRERREGALTIRAALRWLAANKGQPVFVFIHLFDLHTPYGVPERKGISRYDAQLELEDELLGRLKTFLIQSGWWEKSLTVLFSDHGEGLGDHGEQSHGFFVYQSTLAVPLIFHWPAGSVPQSPQVAQAGGLIDVAPTVLEFLHVPAPKSFQGVSLLSAGPHAVYSESFHTHDSFGWAPLRCVRVGNYKYIEAPRPELYDLEKDPAEKTNIALTNPGKAHESRAELGKVLASPGAQHANASTSSSAPQVERLLGSLGYLGRGPRGRGKGSNADPKDRLAEFRLYEKAIEAVSGRRLNEAVVILKQVLAEDETNTLARRDLASCYLDMHDYEKARIHFEQVVKAAPEDYPAQFGLGLAAKHLKREAEARAHLEAACRLAPEALQCKRELESLPRETN